MPIPLYFAVNWKESVNNSEIRLAQGGYGVWEDGSARLPEKQLPGALRIVDDALIPTGAVTEEALDSLACTDGCFLDFERPFCAVQLALTDGLRKRLGKSVLFALPERFAPYATNALPVVSCPKPCNSWREFCRQAHARHPRGWMLELTPWSETFGLADSGHVAHGELSSALCAYTRSKTALHYYDTRKTVAQKLAQAETFGCRAAIGILRELRALK